jgi:hypothetical protein
MKRGRWGRERGGDVPCKPHEHRAGAAVVIFWLVEELGNVLVDGAEVAFLTHVYYCV